MDLTLDSLPSNSNNNKKAQSNKLAVFSSIENRSDLLEGRKSLNINEEMSQNIRSDNPTKRYSIPQNVKDTFYAIHHIQRSIKENELAQSEDIQDVNKKNNGRGRKRVASTDPTTPPPTSTKSNNKKSRQQYKMRKSNIADKPSLYQTCNGIWPEQQEQSLGDFSHDNIQSLSNLLKVRLCQAKFKMMAKLDQDNELFTFLAEEYVSPKLKSPIKIKLNGKQNKSTLSIVGNSKNLFKRNNNSQEPTVEVQQQQKEEKLDFSSKPKERKKRAPRKAKKPVVTTKKKSAAADVTPVIQSDGSTVYVCEPCNKKYKNRNGLAYHLERCKHAVKQNEDSIINCICTQNTDEHGTMVQCDKCRIWLHSECVGLTEDKLDDVFYCNHCKEVTQEDLLQSLLEAQQASDGEDQLLFSQTTHDDEEEEDEDNSSNSSVADGTIIQNNINSTQLHVWDDFSFTSIDNNKNTMDDDEPFSNYDTDLPSSSWTMNDLNLFSQPPSLLFSDNTTTGLPSDSLTMIDECNNTSPVQTTTADGLWFQFANFDDDYQCDT